MIKTVVTEQMRLSRVAALYRTVTGIFQRASMKFAVHQERKKDISFSFISLSLVGVSGNI